MKINDIIKQEEKIKETINKLKEEIFSHVQGSEFPNVKKISSNIVIVKASNLVNNIWSPEFYIPAIQAEYIEKALSTITTGTAFIKRVTEMVEQKGVKINYRFHPFHPVVIEILKKYI